MKKKLQITRVGNTVIVFVDGSTKPIQKTFSNVDDVIKVYDKAMYAESDAEIQEVLAMLSPVKTQMEIKFEEEQEVKVKEQEAKQYIFDFIKDVKEKGHSVFEVKGASVYMKGINISIPEFLLEAIISVETESEHIALINFWKLCALNPDPRAREDLFGFLKGGKFTITPTGYFVAYRNVLVKNEGNKKLTEFVSSNFIKVKGWKKSPRNYSVHEDDNTYKLVSTSDITHDQGHNYLGNLYDLYNSGTETVYTDQRTETFTIKIGEIVYMDRKKCDSDPNQDCSYGLMCSPVI